MLQSVVQKFNILKFHLNAIIVCTWLCIKGLGCLICAGLSEFAHNSPEVWPNLSAWRLEGWTPVWCAWSDRPTWDLISNRPAQAGWDSVLYAHCGTPPGVWKAQLLQFCILLAGWPSTALRVLICQPVLWGSHNKPEIKQIMLRILCAVFHCKPYMRQSVSEVVKVKMENANVVFEGFSCKHQLWW